MKVLLVNPAFKNMVEVPGPAAIPELANVAPPLGLLYVAAFAEKNTPHTVEILDANLDGLSPEQIGDEIRRRAPDVVGITTTTFSLVDVLLTVEAVKHSRPETRVVLGGPHVFLYPEETMGLPGVDYLIVGEGERPFSQLIEALHSGGDLSKVPSLVWRNNRGEVQKNPMAPYVDDLDSLPFPARHLVPLNRYQSVLTRDALIATIMSSRGCPYRCTFCNQRHMGGRFRARSPQSVVEEMELCAQMGIREVMFYDDTFTIGRSRVLAICDLMIERRLPIKWDVRARVNTLDEKLLDRMAEAGCIRIRVGVEAGTPEILRVLRKEIDLDATRRVFAMAAERGITTFAYFILANPTETREQIKQTVVFAKALRADFVEFSAMLPCPGTEVYQMGLEKGLLRNDYWREFAGNPRRDFTPMLWEETLTRDEILKLLDWAFKSFYGRPLYLLRQLSKVRSWSELHRQARAGMKLLLGGVKR